MLGESEVDVDVSTVAQPSVDMLEIVIDGERSDARYDVSLSVGKLLMILTGRVVADDIPSELANNVDSVGSLLEEDDCSFDGDISM